MPFQPKKILGTLAVLLSAAIAAGPAWAVTCSVSATSVNFGEYNAQSATALDGTGAITVACDAAVSGASLRIGRGGSGSYTPRRMTSGANSVTYNLYTTAARTTIWGEGNQGTSTVPVPGTGTYTVYGRVPAGQKIRVGAYTDILTVTLVY